MHLNSIPLIVHVSQVAERGEEVGGVLPEDHLAEAALRVLQAPTLEGMLQRMEEIQVKVAVETSLPPACGGEARRLYRMYFGAEGP